MLSQEVRTSCRKACVCCVTCAAPSPITTVHARSKHLLIKQYVYRSITSMDFCPLSYTSWCMQKVKIGRRSKKCALLWYTVTPLILIALTTFLQENITCTWPYVLRSIGGGSCRTPLRSLSFLQMFERCLKVLHTLYYTLCNNFLIDLYLRLEEQRENGLGGSHFGIP